MNHRLPMCYWCVIGAAVTSPVTVCASHDMDDDPFIHSFIHLVAFVSFYYYSGPTPFVYGSVVLCDHSCLSHL